MIRIRSRLKVQDYGEQALMLHRSAGRRILYGAIAALLIMSAFAGLRLPNALNDVNAVGVFFYLVFLLASGGVAAYDHQVILDRGRGQGIESWLIGPFEIQRREWEIEDVGAIVLQSVSLLRETDGGTGRVGGGMRLRQRARLYRLGIEIGDGVTFIEDSSDEGELSYIGKGLADFIGVDYRVDSL